jgi:hypothetical protein
MTELGGSCKAMNPSPIAGDFQFAMVRYERQFGGCIITYADDLVICCTPQADLALEKMRTHLCRVPVEYFDFLGYTFGRCSVAGPCQQGV